MVGNPLIVLLLQFKSIHPQRGITGNFPLPMQRTEGIESDLGLEHRGPARVHNTALEISLSRRDVTTFVSLAHDGLPIHRFLRAIGRTIGEGIHLPLILLATTVPRVVQHGQVLPVILGRGDQPG